MVNAIQLASFQEGLRQFVTLEHEEQKNALTRIWAMPVEQRVEEGRCVVGGRLQSVREPRGVVVAFPANDSRFRDGDLVRLSQGDPNLPLCDAVVVRADDEWIELELWNTTPGKLGLHSKTEGLQIDETALDLQRFFLAAIEDLGRTDVGRETILPLLAGSQKPSMDISTFDEEHATASGSGFDNEQSKAIASALATDACWLVHGPPGTGKTRVLSWVVRSLVERGERVLVTGANHRTINNLLEGITRLADDTRGIFKVTPFHDPTLTLSQVGRFSEIPKEKTCGAFVIGATPFALRSRRLAGVDFDTVIIDEASQVSVALAVMAMLAGKRYILAGDHHQLPPVRLTFDGGETDAGGSIFERLVGRGMDTMLTTTHRLNEPLCEWPSTEFYLSRLQPSEAAGGRRLSVTNVAPEFQKPLASEPAITWLAVPHEGSRTVSPEEVEAISQLLLALRKGGIRWEDVGVVVPFRRQARFLRQRLRRHLAGSPGSLGFTADTVERMQGQEREVVIVSLTASDPLFVSRVAGFLLQPQRLNVAVTRARTKVLLVASPELVRHARTLPEEISASFLSLIDHAERVEYGTEEQESR